MESRTELYMSYSNILDTIDAEDLYTYCERTYKVADFESADEMMSDLMALEYFSNPKFNSYLEQYYSEQGKDIQDCVRGYCPYKKGFLMFHGVNYDWIDGDLLDGNGSGITRKQFESWLTEKGFDLVK